MGGTWSEDSQHLKILVTSVSRKLCKSWSIRYHLHARNFMSNPPNSSFGALGSRFSLQLCIDPWGVPYTVILPLSKNDLSARLWDKKENKKRWLWGDLFQFRRVGLQKLSLSSEKLAGEFPSTTAYTRERLLKCNNFGCELNTLSLGVCGLMPQERLFGDMRAFFNFTLNSVHILGWLHALCQTSRTAAINVWLW